MTRPHYLHEEFYPAEGEALCLIFHYKAPIEFMIRDSWGKPLPEGQAKKLYDSDVKLKRKIDKILKWN